MSSDELSNTSEDELTTYFKNSLNLSCENRLRGPAMSMFKTRKTRKSRRADASDSSDSEMEDSSSDSDQGAAAQSPPAGAVLAASRFGSPKELTNKVPESLNYHVMGTDCADQHQCSVKVVREEEEASSPPRPTLKARRNIAGEFTQGASGPEVGEPSRTVWLRKESDGTAFVPTTRKGVEEEERLDSSEGEPSTTSSPESTKKL